MSYAFILPRFGEQIGGAETLSGELAKALRDRGDLVEIWTSCARDNRTWENYYEPGIEIVSGIKVRRFSVEDRVIDKWLPLQIAISEGLRVEVEQQLEWMANSVNSSGLYQHIANNHGKFRALFFAPYLFGTSFWGSLVSPDKSILIPCLHDEPAAYQEVFGSMFRLTRGALFNSLPEMQLAQRLYGSIKGGVVGMGFNTFSSSYIEQLGPYFEDDFPYVLYLGRKETGKGVQNLIDDFVRAKELIPYLGDLKLVILGGGSFGDLGRDSVLSRGDIIDLPYLPELEKNKLIHNAVSLINPSLNESFSIVLMEAWKVNVPVVVAAQSAVTRYHVEQSGGGLYYGCAQDLAGVLSELVTQPALRIQLALAGRRYVESEYNWPAVIKRFDQVVDSTIGTGLGVGQ